MSDLEKFRSKMSSLSNSLSSVAEQVSEKGLRQAIELIETCSGTVIVCGVGKSGDIARKIASTMTSLEIPAMFMHPSDAMHGDLGRVRQGDIAFLISHSGETLELTQLIPYLKRREVKIISITGNLNSSLASHSDVVLNDCTDKEICPLNLAPMTSTLVALAIGDVMSAIVAERKQLSREQFARNHPSGRLGKRLTLTVGDVMIPLRNDLTVSPKSQFIEVLNQISTAGCGAVCVTDGDQMKGIITDGDVRRAVQKISSSELISRTALDIMTSEPKVATQGQLAVDALNIMENGTSQISILPVLDGSGKLCGLLRLHDLIRAGI